MICKFWRKGAIAALALAVAVMTPMVARADSISFDIDSPNTAISGYTGPYGTVEVNRTSTTTATITFTALNNGGNFYLFGGAQALNVNVNATSFTVGTPTGSGGNYGGDGAHGIQTPSSAQNADGWGSFNVSFDNFDGAGNALKTASFTLTNTSGTWATAADVLTANSNGATVAAHIFVFASDSPYTNTALATGFAADGGNNTTEEVPEPASIAMVGFGLLGMAGYRWRRRRLTSSAA